MKLRKVKKYLFREICLDTNKKTKSAQNSLLGITFSEYKKYRKPFKGLKYFAFEKDQNIQYLLWHKEKEE